MDMPSTEIVSYLSTLYRLRDSLGPRVDRAEVYVSGRASFLYASHADRAVELFRDARAGWSLEYWTEDDRPVRDETVEDQEEAVRNAMGWLLAARA